MRTVIETKGLVKSFGRRRVLDSLSLAVPGGCICGLVGSNGAGKTTLMMTLAGFLRPDGGEISLLGEGPFDADVHRGRFAVLPQDSELPGSSSAFELLRYYGLLQGLPVRQAEASASEMLRAVNLSDRANSPVRTLSHGMKKRVMTAQCFLGTPEVVLLDEPLNGLDPVEAASLRRFIRGRKGKQTVLVSSHNLHDIEQVCDRVIFMEQGKVVRTASIDELTGRSSVLRYRLSEVPTGFAEFDRVLEGQAAFDWIADRTTVVCRYDGGRYRPEEVNALLLPLFFRYGVLSVEQGCSLEEEFLRIRHPSEKKSGSV